MAKTKNQNMKKVLSIEIADNGGTIIIEPQSGDTPAVISAFTTTTEAKTALDGILDNFAPAPVAAAPAAAEGAEVAEVSQPQAGA
jgi:hypothetical protein